jgi:PPOX class probable F420-dependent enzyme
VVPCCFAIAGARIYSAVDAKQKSTLALRRLANLRHDPRAALLVHHYEEDWTTLWWMRFDCNGRIVDDSDERATALQLLSNKYVQYQTSAPPGDVIGLDIERWSVWP